MIAMHLVKKLKNQKGFTMIEILVSIAVFGVTVPTIVVGINNLNGINNRARDLTLANLLAQNKAEQLRGAGFNSLTPGTYDFSGELPGEISNPKSAEYVVTNTVPGIYQLDISIKYNDFDRERTQTYTTIISELGIGQ